MIAITGNIGLDILILGLVLLLASIIPSPLKADLRWVGLVVLVVGLVIFAILLLL